MSDHALVSVVVPVFDGAQFLDDCLAGLLAQDYPAIEVVVVDDGSSDDSAAIAGRRAGVKVLRRAHEGLAATRNAGVAASIGDFIGFCDADDVWHPAKASRQVAYLDAHPEEAVVLARHDIAFEPGVEPPSWLRRDQLLGDLGGVEPSSGLYRRFVFDRVGGFGTELEAGVDFNFLVRVRTAGLGVGLAEGRLVKRRIHDRNMSSGVGSMMPSMLQSVREHMRQHR